MALSSMEASRGTSSYRIGALVLFVAVGAILTALGFEHIGGYQPCPLCLQQRWAYYAGIPLLFAALVLVASHKPKMAAVLFFLVALAFLANTRARHLPRGRRVEVLAGAGRLLVDAGASGLGRRSDVGPEPRRPYRALR